MVHRETIGNPPDALILDPKTLEPLLKDIYSLDQMLLLGYMLSRISVLALYLRIFTGRKVRTAVWCIVAFLLATWISFGLVCLFACKPVSFFWNKAMDPPGTCVDLNAVYRALTPPNLAGDLAILLVPIPTIWRLKASRLRKLGLTLLFSVAIIAFIISIVRWVAFLRTTALIIAPSYTNTLISWIIIEPGIYLIAACLPAMHHLFAAVTPRFLVNATDRGLSKARSKTGGESSIPTPGKRSSLHGAHRDLDNFTRLVDSDIEANGRGIAESASNPSLTSATGKPRMMMEMSDDKSGTGSRPDLKRVETGDGIMMRTDIIVTTEERIHDVIGF
ncbi:MAG: hypothetical protein M1828_003809 [Chrysothrix sp. TS-e1954]|nr:MAG: hypothetical protein M1828_003809 [Chrysothrix sp. TS-e1954]